MLAATLRLTQEQEEDIIKLMSQTNCPANHHCLSERPEELCRVRSMRTSHYTHLGECLDADGAKCKFSLSWGNGLLCRCGLRLYLAERFDI